MAFEAPHGLTPVGLISALSPQWGIVGGGGRGINTCIRTPPAQPYGGTGPSAEVNQKNNTAIFFLRKVIKILTFHCTGSPMQTVLISLCSTLHMLSVSLIPPEAQTPRLRVLRKLPQTPSRLRKSQRNGVAV